ncbi:DUF3805 domain-containing protein [Phocaeicola plebeius]|uniref:DUF3805 domain-containing protein n=1 Tax=Phocaeicola plebeius TaxID=310297 RepID=UPI0026F3613A|nr:DUF3805 domain-containing protein [Phocaeicola plebeius]
MKKYISPGSCFSLEYPDNWCEFEDSEDCFLFYNPDKWTGNFRISAYRGNSSAYANECLEDELHQVRGAKKVKVGSWDCVYSSESFQENGVWYTTHIWVTGRGEISVECSFTVAKGEIPKAGEAIVASLKVRNVSDKPVKEVIPVRILEINQINENYDWAVSTVKKQLTKDFTGMAADLENLQKVIDSGRFNPKQRQAWESFGTAFGVILVNEMDGMEWVTVIDGQKESPALRFRDSKVMVNPISLIWDKAKSGQPCDLKAEFERIKNEVEATMD